MDAAARRRRGVALRAGRGAAVRYAHPYHTRYSGGGAGALTDGILASPDFKDGLWQGFERDDLDATLDLGRVLRVSSTSVECLNEVESWILLPRRVSFETSIDGNSFTPVGVVENDVPVDSYDRRIKRFTAAFPPRDVRYVRVRAENIGTLPSWHKGAGGGAWIFADEIIVQ